MFEFGQNQLNPVKIEYIAAEMEFGFCSVGRFSVDASVLPVYRRDPAKIIPVENYAVGREVADLIMIPA